MLKAQNIKTNNQYIIAVKCQESQRLFSKKKGKEKKRELETQDSRQPLKKKKIHSTRPSCSPLSKGTKAKGT